MINITYAALHICAHNAILNSKLKLELVEVGVELGKIKTTSKHACMKYDLLIPGVHRA